MFKKIKPGFSVLMSVYHKEKSVFLDEAFKSIWDDQTTKPNEIILVEDGPLTSELYDIIKKWKLKLNNVLISVPLTKNVGLALALNEGLSYCNYEYIARMDTDDISTLNRFSSQIEFLNKNREVDVVGTYISEIDENNIIIKDVVKLPLKHDDLLSFLKKRNPMIHPSVMFRFSFFEKAGMYSDNVMLAEDLHLWYKGFLHGCNFATIPIIGLSFRRSSDFYKRRGSFKKNYQLLKFRVNQINKDLDLGLLANLYAVFYFIIQMAPSFVKKFLYKILR